MNDPDEIEEENWLAEERRKVVEYLDLQGCEHAGIADWPAIHIFENFALWAVQSPRHAGRTGWWVISGDVPTDYMSSSDGEHPRDALRYFSRQWHDVADHMKRGKEHPVYNIGTPAEWPELASMLDFRAEVLADCADDDEVWAEE